MPARKENKISKAIALKKKTGKPTPVAKQPRRINGQAQKSKPFPIVAIGASAGGLDAITELLKNLAPKTGMAYVYIQHLDPSHPSMLSAILQKSTPMTVLEAKNNMHVSPDHLYIIPPNKSMTIIDGTLRLSVRAPKPIVHLPINSFFLSLADKHKEGAIGIILSGNGADGAIGLRSIKNAGGLTFAQDESAKFLSMPTAAIAEQAVDLVLSPTGIAKELNRLAQHEEMFQTVLQETEEIPEKDEEDIKEILQVLERSVNVDFQHYKFSTIRRRIIRRMLLFKLDSLKSYAAYLRKHPDEASALYQDLLINVTNFFRDPVTGDFLKKKIIPRIYKERHSGEQIRIWVTACSGGHEAYSMAMLVVEALGDKALTSDIQIFATDLSEASINKARLGIYSKSEVAEISAKRLARFFTKMDGNYRILKSIRDMCVFAQHNIVKDPPFSHLDLISCCNLMIYLDTFLQKKILSTLHYSLKNNGFLVLGKSESVSSAPQLFSSVDRKSKVYSKRKDVNSKATFNMSNSGPFFSKTPSFQPRDRSHKTVIEEKNFEQLVDQVLLAQYTPVGVVINSDMDIQLFRGATAPYLEPPQGKAQYNLLKMARGSLKMELRNALQKVKSTGQPFKKTGIEMGRDGTGNIATIEVAPMTIEKEKYYIVLFSKAPDPIIKIKPASKNKRAEVLEAEMSTLREDMRSLVESQEAANEELQSANEEIVSTNEELQSINEELETSKEEIESSNEELTTINQELQTRNEQLAELHEYSDAVLKTLRESVVVLDKDLRVKTANRTFYKTFHFQEE